MVAQLSVLITEINDALTMDTNGIDRRLAAAADGIGEPLMRSADLINNAVAVDVKRSTSR